MKQRPRICYSDAQKALMWDRWQHRLESQAGGAGTIHGPGQTHSGSSGSSTQCSTFLPTIVINTSISTIASGSTVRGLSDSTIRSANLPGIRLPILSSMNSVYAPFIVIMRSASSTLTTSAVIQSGGSQTWPLGLIPANFVGAIMRWEPSFDKVEAIIRGEPAASMR